LRVFRKLPEKKFEIIFFERNIRIQGANNLVIQMFRVSIPRVEAVGFTCKIATLALRHLKQLNPLTVPRITRHDFVCAVCGTIADNKPSHRPDRLTYNRANREFDKGLLVSRRRYQKVSQAWISHRVTTYQLGPGF